MKMFEKQKWSKALKKAATEFLNYVADNIVEGDEENLAKLIEMAMEEARDEMVETVNDWYDDSDREPQRDESRD